jgi:thymidylate synthase (FAD)
LLISPSEAVSQLRKIERCGRVCYKSEDKIGENTYEPFIRGIIKRGHESVLEHCAVTAFVVCDRGVTHEIVRHRIGSYSQESTRYVNYKTGMNAIDTPFWKNEDGEMTFDELEKWQVWTDAMKHCEEAYKKLIELGAKPEEARSVLPNSLKTEIAITYNLREWRHFFTLRCSKFAHPQMRQVAVMLLKQMKELMPVIFEDFVIDEAKNTAEKV